MPNWRTTSAFPFTASSDPGEAASIFSRVRRWVICLKLAQGVLSWLRRLFVTEVAAAQNLASHRGHVPDQHAYRCRVEAIAWIIDLRTIGQHAQYVHFCEEVDVSTRLDRKSVV